MCMACEMEAMWFAAMEARARAVAAEADPQANLLPPPEAAPQAALPPPPEEGGGSKRTFACEETQAE
jgi:hypothetical protein